MAAKDVRNLIVTMIILAIGIKLLTYIAGRLLSGKELIGVGQEIFSDVQSMSDLLVIGIIVLIVILVPVYLSKRSYERKYGEMRSKQE